MTVKVISMDSTYENHTDLTLEGARRHAAARLYAAAASVFSLPPHRQVLTYLRDGIMPEVPESIDENIPNEYAIGRMRHPRRDGECHCVRIVTAGGRAVEVSERHTSIYFQTGLRNASEEAAGRVLAHLQMYRNEEVCIVRTTDGQCIPNTEVAPGGFARQGKGE